MDAMAGAHSQPHLSLRSSQSYSDDDPEDGDDGSCFLSSSSSSRELRSVAALSGQSSLRRRSYGDVVFLPAGAGAGAGTDPRGKQPGHGYDGKDDDVAEHAASVAYLQMCEALAAAPGYVSFEDVIDGGIIAMSRGGSGRPPFEATVISDPLLRTASRLYAREEARPPPHHRRQPSPGPMGTRRGSAMHVVVKKYVHPFLGFLAAIFCCCSPRDDRRVKPTV